MAGAIGLRAGGVRDVRVKGGLAAFTPAGSPTVRAQRISSDLNPSAIGRNTPAIDGGEKDRTEIEQPKITLMDTWRNFSVCPWFRDAS